MHLIPVGGGADAVTVAPDGRTAAFGTRDGEGHPAQPFHRGQRDDLVLPRFDAAHLEDERAIQPELGQAGGGRGTARNRLPAPKRHHANALRVRGVQRNQVGLGRFGVCDQEPAAAHRPSSGQLEVGTLGAGIGVREALESEIVNDGERVARPRERNDVGWHEQQVRMGAREGQRKAHLRPQARERDDGEVDPKTGAGA